MKRVQPTSLTPLTDEEAQALLVTHDTLCLDRDRLAARYRFGEIDAEQYRAERARLDAEIAQSRRMLGRWHPLSDDWRLHSQAFTPGQKAEIRREWNARKEYRRERSAKHRDRLVESWKRAARRPQDWTEILEELGYLGKTDSGQWYWPRGPKSYRLTVRQLQTLWKRYLKHHESLSLSEWKRDFNVPPSFDHGEPDDDLPLELRRALESNGYTPA